MSKPGRRRLRQMRTITRKGYEAMKNGEPRKPPYKGAKCITRPRNYAWLDGWDAAYREEVERRLSQGTQDPDPCPAN